MTPIERICKVVTPLLSVASLSPTGLNPLREVADQIPLVIDDHVPTSHHNDDEAASRPQNTGRSSGPLVVSPAETGLTSSATTR
jgi:hypothetical protein